VVDSAQELSPPLAKRQSSTLFGIRRANAVVDLAVLEATV